MSEFLEMHYELMKSNRWKIDRSDPTGEVYYYPTNAIYPTKMILEDAFKLEKVLQAWSNPNDPTPKPAA